MNKNTTVLINVVHHLGQSSITPFAPSLSGTHLPHTN